MKKVLLILVSFALLNAAMSQGKNPWSLHTSIGKIITDKSVARLSFPTEYKLFNLNTDELRQQLFSVVDNQASRHSTIISLPNTDGNIEQFEVFIKNLPEEQQNEQSET